MVNIKASFKKDDKPNDGLQRISEELTRRPHERRIVVGIIRPTKTTINHEDGTSVPTIKFDHIEALDGDDAKAAWEALGHAFEDRTGNPLPPQSLFDSPAAPEPDQDPLPGFPEPSTPEE